MRSAPSNVGKMNCALPGLVRGGVVVGSQMSADGAEEALEAALSICWGSQVNSARNADGSGC